MTEPQPQKKPGLSRAEALAFLVWTAGSGLLLGYFGYHAGYEAGSKTPLKDTHQTIPDSHENGTDFYKSETDFYQRQAEYYEESSDRRLGKLLACYRDRGENIQTMKACFKENSHGSAREFAACINEASVKSAAPKP